MCVSPSFVLIYTCSISTAVTSSFAVVSWTTSVTCAIVVSYDSPVESVVRISFEDSSVVMLSVLAVSVVLSVTRKKNHNEIKRNIC